MTDLSMIARLVRGRRKRRSGGAKVGEARTQPIVVFASILLVEYEAQFRERREPSTLSCATQIVKSHVVNALKFEV